jgi:CMP/dCMP kinase
MTTITISRQYGSLGDEIARRVCEILGYGYFDKLMIIQAARSAGLSEQEIIDYSEENYKIRNFFDRLMGRSQTVAQMRVWKEDSKGARTSEEISLDEDAALKLVQDAIHYAHTSGNVVIVGRGGQILLRDLPDVLHVRIEAPEEDRIQRVKEWLRTSDQPNGNSVDLRREAQDLINIKDGHSADYIKRFYNADWDDPHLYHLVLNSGKLSIEQAAQIISKLTLEFDLQEKKPELAATQA